MSNGQVLRCKFWFLSEKEKAFFRFRPCRKPKPLTSVKMNGINDSDEDVSLKEQLKENDSS